MIKVTFIKPFLFLFFDKKVTFMDKFGLDRAFMNNKSGTNLSYILMYFGNSEGKILFNKVDFVLFDF